MNYKIVRRWTSQTCRSGPTGYSRSCQAIIDLTYNLKFLKLGSVNKEIGRRAIIYRTTRCQGKLKPFSNVTINHDGRLQFTSISLSVSQCYERVLVLLEIALEAEIINSVITSPLG